jgi:hypothetical protein
MILFSFHPELYAIPHPEPAGTIMVTEDIPVGPLWNPQGSRKRGRPKTSWRSVTKEAGRRWNELRFLAADRQKWKELIDNLCS